MCCYHCHAKKKLPKKFSAENNMDPSDISEKEMLIAQVFTVMSVY